MHATFLSLILVSLCGITNALRIPVTARRELAEANAKSPGRWSGGRRYGGRGGGVRTSMMADDDLTIDNAKDIVYATNITLGGKEFPIQLDTGSSDVWVMPPFKLNTTRDTKIPVELTFGIGKASGNISFAPMELGNYKVKEQAFLNATNATSFDAIFNNGIFGILGLSFDQGSSVFVDNFVATNKTDGRTFLGNVFAQNASAPNMFTVLLGRTDDTDGNQEGIFTVGEYDPEFPDLASQPKLLRTPAQLTAQSVDIPRWSVQMDAMKVNGKAFQFNKSNVAEAAAGKTVAVLDTGFTFSQIPPAAVDAIYQSIPGATFNNATKLYEVPCTSTTELVFTFGGVDFPVDPLDITVVKLNDKNETVCNNAFRSISLPPGAPAALDMILGVSFLKNAYTSFDFGDWTPDNTTAGVPFVQMLPTTNLKKAAETFPQIRKKQVEIKKASVTAPTSTVAATATATSTAKATATATAANNAANNAAVEAFVNALRSFINSVKTRRADADADSQPGSEPLALTQPVHAHSHNGGGRVRIVVASHLGGPIRIPMMPASVSRCANRVLNSHGPVFLTVLSGIMVLMLVAAVAGTVLAVRAVMRRREDGYEAIYIRDESEVVEDDQVSRY
ncbi:aspartic peptidase domain-containing protein [Cristinia sonorae]|uniref:Aspartic peptidase domain-containing protein n=1 Tax=Cristinia sonorae TaxID=1940300 RepID=A0A8K0UUN7_9AGAR|nr:aspartic peptidase domain-containing protein [Cristinia sonorae]